MMNLKEINTLSAANSQRANDVLTQSGIIDVLEKEGCTVNLVGSLRMGLLARHRDIDLHVYSSNITIESSFAVMAKLAADTKVTEIRCINGLHTDERCIAWHLKYAADTDDLWQIDIIHIEKGSKYDGYFEHMADRICSVMTSSQRETILRLKFDTPASCDWHGVEYYEAVIADGVTTINEMEQWVSRHRNKTPYYWIP